MTLFEIINKLKTIAISKPNINYAGDGDVYTLNSLPNIDYSVFFVTQNDHSIESDTITYNLNLFYIDRISDSEDNTLNIQSDGMLQLTNIINTLVFSEDVDVDGEINFVPFIQRFADQCAGVYCTVRFIVDNSLGSCSYE